MTSTTTIRKSSYGGNRKLNPCFPEDYIRLVKQKNNANAPKKPEDFAKLVKYIDDNVIGKSNAFLGPFGRRKGTFNFFFLFISPFLHAIDSSPIFRATINNGSIFHNNYY